MGLALLVVIWLITLISTYFFVAKTWWLPVGAAQAAGFIDGQLALTFVLMGIIFLAAQLSLGYIVWRYREQPSSPPVLYSHGNTRLEIVWTVLTTVLFVGLNLMGSTVWASQRFDQAGPGAVQVEVTGMQFAWYFRYPGPDGKYGATSPKLMDPSAGGEAAVGLNTSDPAAKDDVVTGTMYLPVDREVDVSLRAVDVIHSFFVPSLRFKQDTVPGLNIHMHFKPTAIGEYEIACAELCGLGHYKMHGMVHVVSQEDFDKWLAAREGEKKKHGRYGEPARARSSGFHSKIYFQPGSQSHWPSVFFSGAHCGICRNVSVSVDANSPGLAGGGSAVCGRDQAGNVSQSADHARHHYGVFRADHRAAGRIRKLFSANSDRRAGYGVSRPEHAFVLDDVCGIRCDPCRLLRDRRRSTARVDGIRSAERTAVGRTRRSAGRRSLDYEHCDFLRGVINGGAELHHYHTRPAGQGHDFDAYAAHGMVVVHYRDSWAAGVWCSALSGNSVVDGS